MTELVLPNLTAMASLNPEIILDDVQQSSLASLERPDSALCCVMARPDALVRTLFQLGYLSKGAANVVFKCHFRKEVSPVDVCFQIVHAERGSRYARPIDTEIVRDMVLRLPRGMPKCLSAEDIMYGLANYILPLFVPHGDTSSLIGATNIFGATDPPCATTINLPSEDFSKYLMWHAPIVLLPDVMEHLVEQTPPSTFKELPNHIDLPISYRRWAILLPDLSSIPGTSFTLEIKPKWLAQSSNAPAEAVRCRTCAMQVINPKNRETYVCPLRLVNGTHADLYPWVQNMVDAVHLDPANNFKLTSKAIVCLANTITTYLTVGDGRALLKHLRYLQQELDPQGVLRRPSHTSTDAFDHNLRLAMTLRDCSLFIKVSYNADGTLSTEIISKLGDLDFKSAEKIPDWAEKESKLGSETAYTSKDANPECWLFPPEQT